MESLADFLGVPKISDPAPDAPQPALEDLANITDPAKFCQGIVASREFRQYILTGILMGPGKDGLPPAVMCRIMDHAWGKPAEHIEHSGKDGGPVVTEVRRVIVRTVRAMDAEDAEKPAVAVH